MLILVNYLYRLDRFSKLIVLFIGDFCISLISFLIAILLKSENVLFLFDLKYLILIFFTGFTSVIISNFLGIYQNITRYISFESIGIFFVSSALTGISIIIISYILSIFLPISISIIFILVNFICILGIRILFRTIYLDQIQSKNNTLIYGAGSGGLRLLSSLKDKSLYNVIAFVDDNVKLKNKKISGLSVFNSDELADTVKKYDVNTLLIAIPSANNKIRQSILKKVENLRIKILSVPNIDKILSGRFALSDLMNISVEELLGRDPIPPYENLLSKNITNKNIFISGAGGSIGGELSQQVIIQNPKSLILYDISEYNLYQIQNQIKNYLHKLEKEIKVYTILGNVNDKKRLTEIFRDFQINTIYHAAAYKHVPIIEENISEGINNNVFGTKIILETAIEEKVDSFILISTDKAVNPTSIMGASKRIAELICQSKMIANYDTKISIVRFGNVLNSSGSVIPLFKSQITNNEPVTITHKEVTRYFMTIPEAAQLVIQAGALHDGKSVYILDMGKPIKISKIAEDMIRSYGFIPTYNLDEYNKDKHNKILITINGLRKGEKLHEELFMNNKTNKTLHPKILSAEENPVSEEIVNKILKETKVAVKNNDIIQLNKILSHKNIGLIQSE